MSNTELVAKYEKMGETYSSIKNKILSPEQLKPSNPGGAREISGKDIRKLKKSGVLK